MAQAFRLKTQPEILLAMLMQARGELDATGNGDVSLDVGSVWRTFLEICAESDADQYIQIGKIPKLFSIFTAKGNDLDLRMVDYGSDVFSEMKRLPANTSISGIAVGDGTFTALSFLTNDIDRNSTAFSVDFGDGAGYASSGAVVLEQGTTREETIIFTRIFDIFTVIFPLTGVANAHPQGGTVRAIAIRSFLQSALFIGNTSIILPTGTGSAWQLSGSVVIDQGTVSEEKKAFTRVGDTLTVAAVTFGHPIGTSLIQSTFGSDRNISVGQICFVPATATSREIDFRVSQVGAKLLDGSFISNLITVESADVGVATRVGSNTITKWASPPFTGATVTNPIAATRGRNREEDSDYVQRAINVLQSLSNATPLATTTKISGVTDPITGAQVAFAQIVEPVSPGMSLLYITDGSSNFALSQSVFAGRDVLISDAEAGDRRGRLNQFGPFVVATALVSPRLFVSFQRGTATAVGSNTLTDGTKTFGVNFYTGAFLKADDNTFYRITSNTGTTFTLAAGGATPSLGVYSVVDFGTFPQISSTTTAVGVGTLTDSTQTMTVNAHTGKWITASDGVSWLVLSNTATVFTLQTTAVPTPAAGAYRLTSGNPTPLVPGVDYLFNQTNGDVELVLSKALVVNDSLIAASDGSNPAVGAYTYTTGLGAYVQRLVNGDSTDFTTFPGIRADGTQVLVTAPITISNTFTLQVIAARGFSDSDIVPNVQVAVETYVNSLGIGENVLVSEIIRVVKSLVGVADVKLIDPTANITVPAGAIMRISASNVVPL